MESKSNQIAQDNLVVAVPYGVTYETNTTVISTAPPLPPPVVDKETGVEIVKPEQPLQQQQIATTTVEEKQGQKCCGCCCDFRRAVIIVNIVLMILEFLVIVILASGTNVYTSNIGTDEFDDHMKKYETIEMLLSVVSIILSGLAIAGASKYNIFMVGANAVWLIVGYAIGILNAAAACWAWEDESEPVSNGYYTIEYECQLNGGGVLMGLGVALCFAYPHIGFIQEVNKGIMSEETYEREKFSCCCV